MHTTANILKCLRIPRKYNFIATEISIFSVVLKLFIISVLQFLKHVLEPRRFTPSPVSNICGVLWCKLRAQGTSHPLALNELQRELSPRFGGRSAVCIAGEDAGSPLCEPNPLARLRSSPTCTRASPQRPSTQRYKPLPISWRPRSTPVFVLRFSLWGGFGTIILIIAADITCISAIFTLRAPAGSFRCSRRMEMEAFGW